MSWVCFLREKFINHVKGDDITRFDGTGTQTDRNLIEKPKVNTIFKIKMSSL